MTVITNLQHIRFIIFIVFDITEYKFKQLAELSADIE